MSTIRIGTRGSALALAQAKLVADMLAGAGVEIVPIRTAGDSPASTPSDKSRFVKEIEDALLSGEIDLAVHSAKDLPGKLPDGLEILSVPEAEDPRDVLAGATSLGALAPGARVGTSSLRRRSQLLANRHDLDVLEMRGNVDTRLRKLAEGDYDAIVIALAGLRRLGRADEAGAILDGRRFVPAPGQGMLALQTRVGDEAVGAVVGPLDHEPSHARLRCERAVVARLDASCTTPVGAGSAIADGALEAFAYVGLPDGSEWITDAVTGDVADAAGVGRLLAERLLAAGAGELLRRAG